MSNEIIAGYVRDERARGVTDEALRAELLQKGWSQSSIREVMGTSPETSAKDSREVLSGPVIMRPPEWIASRVLPVGFVVFLVSSALLLEQGAGQNLDNRAVFAAFTLTHIVNIVAAFFLLLSVWRLSRSIGFHIWIALLSVVVVLFAATSLPHFISLATGSAFFDALQRGLLGDDYLPLIIYFILLPLQAIVFALLHITLWVLGYLRKRRGEMVVLRSLHLTIFIFFIMSLLALGDLYFVLSGVSFGM